MSSISRSAIDSSIGIRTGEIIEEIRFTTAGTSVPSVSEALFFEFYVDTTEYEVEVDANTGRVTDFSVERHDGRRDGGFDSRRGYDDDWYDYDDRFDWDD